MRSKQRINRIINDLFSYLNAFRLVIRSKPEVILVTGRFLRFMILGKLCSFILRAKFVRESSEVPFFREPMISRFKIFRLKAEHTLFDGLIVISNRLEKFYSQDLSLKTKILNIPILVSETESIKSKNRTVMRQNFVYTGSLVDNKDGILTIIKAFAKVQKKYPDIKLTMTGDIDQSPDKNRILSLLQELSLIDKVTLTGYISKRELDEITRNALALVSAKPNNRQNRYNMATKVGEYLQTARPVIVSAVDAACQYLSHRENAFVVKPDENAIAKELSFILDHPDKADHIGLMGRYIAKQHFDYKLQMQKTEAFFKELIG